MATSAPFENPVLENTSLMPPPPDGGAPPDANGTQRLRTSKSQWVCHSLPVQIGDEPEKDVHAYYSKNGGSVPLFDLVRVAMVLCCVEKGTAQTAVSAFFKTHTDVEKVRVYNASSTVFLMNLRCFSSEPPLFF